MALWCATLGLNIWLLHRHVTRCSNVEITRNFRVIELDAPFLMKFWNLITAVLLFSAAHAYRHL